MDHVACQNYGNCINNEKKNLKYPIENTSLYSNRIVDNQLANRRCYEKNPIEIVEGFNTTNGGIVGLLKWIIILVIVYYIVSYAIKYMATEELPPLGIRTSSTGGSSDTPQFIRDLINNNQ
jgi:hypothetical protein